MSAVFENISSLNASLTHGVSVRLLGGKPRHKFITFPRMNGAEVLDQGYDYYGVEVNGMITGASVSAVDTAFAAFSNVINGMRGTSSDKVTITYGDSSSSSISYLVCESMAASQTQLAAYSSTYARKVTVVLRQVNNG